MERLCILQSTPPTAPILFFLQAQAVEVDVFVISQVLTLQKPMICILCPLKMFFPRNFGMYFSIRSLAVFLCSRDWTVWGTTSLSPSITVPSPPLFSLSQGFHFLLSQSSFVTNSYNSIRGNLSAPGFAEWHIRVSNLLFCSPTLSASPKTSLSFSSFLMWASGRHQWPADSPQ